MNKKVFIVAVPDEVGIQGNILGYPVMFSGVGKINAAMTATMAFSLGYDEIINIGSCGSLSLPIGDVVKVGFVYQDIDTTPLDEYGKTPFESISKQIVLDSKSNISCFTTDYFYDENQKIKYSPYYLEMIKRCSIIDMECFAIAKVCKRYGVKFSAYKWVSDGGDHSHWKTNCEIGFKKTKEIINEKFEKGKI
jgi:adenosylhomocysteine nucleosidase